MSSGSNGSDDFRGLRSRVSNACRLTLREVFARDGAAADGASDAAREHLAACSFCAARVGASAPLAAWAAQRPATPKALDGLLDSIYERVSETAEDGALGSWIQAAEIQSLQVQATNAADLPVAPSDLAAELASVPEVANGVAWSGVRESILRRVADDRSSEAASRRASGRLLVASVAAAVLITAIVLLDFRRPDPVIVFADLDQAPEVDFAVVRYGVRDR